MAKSEIHVPVEDRAFVDNAPPEVSRVANAIGYTLASRGVQFTADDAIAAAYRVVDEVEAENEQLRYERRLLGWARMTLDLVAAGDASRWEQARREAEDIAQRIVDEIGHPVTDEPTLGPGFRAIIERAQAEHARDDSNPRGPWCNTCLTVWPCRTAVALDPCPRCNGSRFEPGTEEDGDWDPAATRHHPYTGEPCSACNGSGKRP